MMCNRTSYIAGISHCQSIGWGNLRRRCNHQRPYPAASK
jgi:hypothetical protein